MTLKTDDNIINPAYPNPLLSLSIPIRSHQSSPNRYKNTTPRHVSKHHAARHSRNSPSGRSPRVSPDPSASPSHGGALRRSSRENSRRREGRNVTVHGAPSRSSSPGGLRGKRSCLWLLPSRWKKCRATGAAAEKRDASERGSARARRLWYRKVPVFQLEPRRFDAALGFAALRSGLSERVVPVTKASLSCMLVRGRWQGLRLEERFVSKAPLMRVEKAVLVWADFLQFFVRWLWKIIR